LLQAAWLRPSWLTTSSRRRLRDSTISRATLFSQGIEEAQTPAIILPLFTASIRSNWCNQTLKITFIFSAFDFGFLTFPEDFVVSYFVMFFLDLLILMFSCIFKNISIATQENNLRGPTNYHCSDEVASFIG